MIFRTMKELNEIVKELKPSVLIGAAAVPKVGLCVTLLTQTNTS